MKTQAKGAVTAESKMLKGMMDGVMDALGLDKKEWKGNAFKVPVTPQVPAISGMTPLGLKPLSEKASKALDKAAEADSPKVVKIKKMTWYMRNKIKNARNERLLEAAKLGLAMIEEHGLDKMDGQVTHAAKALRVAIKEAK